MAAERSIIHQSENVRLVAQDLGGDVVFVTFNEMGMTWNGDSFWGDAFFAKNGLTAFGFVTPKPNWYPRDEMEEAIETAKSLIGGRRVVTYGHSQGGYGALKFGRSLSASVTLSFCPQISIDPADGEIADVRYTRYYRSELRNGRRIEPSEIGQRCFVFYDPHESGDCRSFRAISKFPGVEQVLVPFSMHDTIRVVTEGKVAAQLVRATLTDDGLTAERLRTLVRTARRNSGTYHTEKTRVLLNRGKSQTRFLDMHLETYSDGALKKTFLAVSAACRADLVAANQIISDIKDDDMINLDLLFLWTTFRNSGFKFGELKIAPLLKVKYPEDCFRRLHAVNSYVHFNIVDKAIEELSEIESLPTANKFCEHFARFYLNIKYTDLAEKYIKLCLQSKALSDRDMLDLYYDLVYAYDFMGRRQQSIRILMELSDIYQDRYFELKSIAAKFCIYKAFSLALELYKKLLRRFPDDIDCQFGLVRATVEMEKSGNTEALDAFLLLRDIPGAILETATFLYVHRNKFDRALGAAERALKAGANEVQCRKVILNCSLRQKKFGPAAEQIAQLLANKDIGPQTLRELANAADECKSAALRLKVAERRWSLGGQKDLDCIVYLLKQLDVSCERERIAALVDTAIQLLEAGCEADLARIIELAEICSTKLLSHTLERRAIDLGLAYFEDNAQLLAARKMNEMIAPIVARRAASPERPMQTRKGRWKLFRNLTGVLAMVVGISATIAGAFAAQPWQPSPDSAKYQIDMHEKLKQTLPQQKPKVLFIGDSLTARWHGAGKASWDRFFAPLLAANAGIEGATTQGLLWRINDGEFAGLTPAALVVLIGTNDIQFPVDDVAHGIIDDLRGLHRSMPKARIIVLGLWPRDEPGSPIRLKVESVNKILTRFVNDHARNGIEDAEFYDFSRIFLDKDGKFKDDYALPDLTHFNAVAYAALAPLIRTVIEEPDNGLKK